MKPSSARFVSFVSAALVGVLGLTGCSDTGSGQVDSAEATIAIGSLYEPANLDNTAGGGQGVTEAFNGNVYESLLRPNDDGTLTPLLAKEITASEDGLSYTASIRTGVTFHSGAPLTSADVKASLERVIAPDSQSARKKSFAVLDTIETPDDHTVVFRLKDRSISFPYLLSFVWIVGPADLDFSSEEDGTGPYRLGEWKRGSSLSLKRFDDYWGDAPKNAGVVFNYYTEATALNNALLTGAIDVITAVQNPDSVEQFSTNDSFTVAEGTSTTKELLVFNDRVAPFNNPAVRQALYSAIDREKLRNAVWGDYGKVIGSMVPPTDPWYEDLVKLNPYDPERSKTLLQEAGLSGGFSFTLDTPSYDPHPVVAEFVKSELAKVGVTVNIVSITADEWYTKVFKERDYQVTLQEHVNDRDVVWYGNPDFYWGYDNPEVTKLVEEAESAKTEAAQTEKLKAANRIIAEEAASAWLYLYPQIVVSASNVSGYPVNGLNSQFYAYNIEKK